MHRTSNVRRFWVAGLALSALIVVACAQPSAAQSRADRSAELTADYERQFEALKADDLEGHFRLALWCRDNEAWELLRRQCIHVLSLDRDHAQTKLLQQLAQRHLGEPSGSGQPGAGTAPGSAAGTAGRPRLLTEAEIQRIRWVEFDDESEPRPLAIQFTNNVVDRFFLKVEGRPRFTTDEEKRQFRSRPANDKLRDIREETGDEFAGDIVIKSDPRRMADFERKALPVILGGCATSGCHGGVTNNPFVLYTDAVMDDPKVYTNYLYLHEYRVGEKRVLDRESPDRSLVLTYGLKELSASLDPSYKHPTEIKPIYRGVSDPRYQAVYEWIDSFSPIDPAYGISFSTPPPAGPTP